MSILRNSKQFEELVEDFWAIVMAFYPIRKIHLPLYFLSQGSIAVAIK